MDQIEIEKYLGNLPLSLSEAMRKIDENANGVLFLTDKDGRLKYCISDGDIRRYLLKGGRMEADASEAANAEPKYAYSIDEAVSLYHRRNWVVIPVLDMEGKIIDLYTGGSKKKAKAKLHIPVVINAGGKGTRLDPFTKVLPKPLIPVGNLPIIEHIMKEFSSYDCNDFHVIVNYKRQLIKAYFESGDEKPYQLTWYDEETPLGTGGGLCLLKGKMDQTFFFSNCDNLLTANYERILEFHKENKNVITMVCAYKNLSVPYGVVEIGMNGNIETMKEKPIFSFLTNTGIYVVEPEVLEDIEDYMPIGFPDVIMKQKEKGRRVAVFPIGESDWMDMGQMSELEKMRIRLYGE